MIFWTWFIRPGFLQRHPIIRLLLLGFVVLCAVALIQTAAGSDSTSITTPQTVYYPSPSWIPPPLPSANDHPDIPLAAGAYWYSPGYGEPGAGVVWLHVPAGLDPSSPDFCPDVGAGSVALGDITETQADEYPQYCAGYNGPWAGSATTPRSME